MLYYFLTIDKVDTSTDVSISDYKKIVNKWLELGIINKPVYPVECYEENSLGRLHYHAIFSAQKMINYSKHQIKGYSIRWKYLKTKKDVFNTCGYINKNKSILPEHNSNEHLIT